MDTQRSLGERLMQVFSDFGAGLMHFLSDLKVYRWPMFVLYDPGSYLVKGEDARKAIDTVKPGDILLRRYQHYLNGYFIPGYFSHAGLYLGNVDPDDIKMVPSGSGQDHFRAGKQMVVHALGEGVLMEDLLSFCRCDQMAILRFPDTIERGAGSHSLVNKWERWSKEEEAIYLRLEEGDRVEFQTEAFPLIRRSALGYVGKLFDYGLKFDSPERICCTELVHWCTQFLHPFLQIEPRLERLFVFCKTVILPDTFLDSKLRRIWCSESTRRNIRTRFS